MATKDLIKSLEDKQTELRKLHFGSAGSRSRDVKGLKKTRKEIARILTELNQTNG